MTKIVGIDFGTANVRIAQWDIGIGNTPTSALIGEPADNWMPATIAFRKQRDGTLATLVGEAADEVDDNAPDTVVVRNIKRYATASDPVVRTLLEWGLDQRGMEWPQDEWLTDDETSIEVWDEKVPVAEAMKLILKEAIARAGLAGEAAQWRAGCPVSSNLAYRKALIAALDELGCVGKVEWLSEEPLLLVALGCEVGSLSYGRYMVYDMGGGSFDCAVVGVEELETENELSAYERRLVVYAESGLPIGGMDIDRDLKSALGYKGSMVDLRVAKEQLSDRIPSIQLSDGNVLTAELVNSVSERYVQPTLNAVLETYEKSKFLLGRGEFSTSGYTVTADQSQRVRDMVSDIDKVLVVGGPTRVRCFADRLRDVFGHEKVMMAEDLVRIPGRDISEARLTALSHGACYMYGNWYIPVTLDRVPVTITLTVTDGIESQQDAYEAFHRMPYRNPWADYNGNWVALASERPKTYRVLIESADGGVLHDSGEHSMRMPRDGYLGPLADRAKLVIDRFGSVWVRLEAGPSDVPQPLEDNVVILRNPEWQTRLQKEAVRKLEEIQRQREEEAKAVMLRNLNPKPRQVS